MAVRTQSLVPFTITSIPDRLTPIYVTDKRIVTTTAGTGAVVRLNRLQGATFSMDTPVTEISEMGAQFRVGGIDDLGESKFKLDFATVSIQNLAALTATTVLTGSGQVTNIGLTQFQNAQVDLIRLVADPTNTVFGTLYMQDCVIDDYAIDVKEKSMPMDTVNGRGPNATFFPGFVLPKTYVVQAADVSSNSIPITSVLGADEAPVQIYLPGSNTPPSYWQQNGSKYFLKVEQIPGAVLTNTPVRYTETASPAAQTVTYNSGTKVLAFPAGKLAAGDLIRLVFLSYNTDSFPLTVPANTPDTTERAAVAARLAPVKISANQLVRVQSASVKFSLKRDHVQGVGENAIVYGVPAIPDVSIDFDIKEYDLTLLSLLQTGSPNLTSQGGTIQNDFADLNYLTRVQLANAVPFSILVNDPFNVGVTLVSFTSPQIVVKGLDYSSSNKADNTVKVTALDITGNLTVSFTHP